MNNKKIVKVITMLLIMVTVLSLTIMLSACRFSLGKGDLITYDNVTYMDGDIDITPENVIAPNNYTPKKDGHTFVSWALDSNGNGTFDMSAYKGEEVVLYAVWTVNEYRVKFVDHDGSVIKVDGADEQLVKYNTSAKNPDEPTRYGYTFTGWDKDYTSITEDTLITATYERTLAKVQLYCDSKVLIEKNDLYVGDSLESFFVICASALKDYTSNGLTIVGWFSDAELTQKIDTQKAVAGEVTDVYPCFNVVSNTTLSLQSDSANDTYAYSETLSVGVSLSYTVYERIGYSLVWFVDDEKIDGETAQSIEIKGLAQGRHTVKAQLTSTYNNSTIEDERSIEILVSIGTIRLKADDISVKYGDTVPSFTYSVVDGDDIELGNIRYTTSYTQGDRVGTYTISINEFKNELYELVFIQGTLTVEPKPVTVTANTVSLTYGEALPNVFAYTVNGRVSTDDAFGTAIASCIYGAGSNVGNYDIEISGLENPNYIITQYINGELVVNPRELDYKVIAKDIVFGEEAIFSYKIIKGELFGNDTLGTPIYDTEYNKGSDIKDDYAVTLRGLSNSNYTFPSEKTTSFKVSPLSVEVNWNVKGNYEYNGLDQLSEIKASFYDINNDSVALTIKPYISNTEALFKNAGTYDLEAISGNKNYRLTANRITRTITPKNATITIDSASTVYGDDAPLFNASESGLCQGDSLDYTIVCSYSVGSDKGEYDIDAVGKFNSNYSVTVIKGNLSVSSRAVFVEWSGDNDYTYNGLDQRDKVMASIDSYDGSAITLTPQFLLDGEISNFKNAGTYLVIVSLDNENYEINDTERSLYIFKKDLTVTAQNATTVYGSSAPKFVSKFDGFVNNENESVLNGTLTHICSYGVGYSVNEYDIRPLGLSSDNYEIDYVSGILTVTPLSVSVKWNIASSYIYNGRSQKSSVTAQFRQYNGIDKKVDLTFDGDFIHVGEYSVEASIENDNYTLTDTSRTIEISPKALEIKAKSIDVVYGSSILSSQLGYTHTALATGDSISSVDYDSTSYSLGSNVGNYLLKVSNAVVSNSSDYTISYVDGSITVSKLSRNVKWNIGTYVYNGLEQSVSATYNTYDGSVVDMDLSYISMTDRSNTLLKSAGKYTVTATAKSNDINASNYDFNITSKTVEIAPKAITVSVNALAVSYGERAVFTYSAPELIEGDELSDIVYECTYAIGSDIGTYPVSITNIVSGNYSISTVGSILTVNAKRVDLIWTIESSYVYSGNSRKSDIVAKFVDIQNNTQTAVLSFSGELKHVGSYNVNASFNSNYSFNNAQKSVSITAKPITVIVNDLSVIYGNNASFTYTAPDLIGGDVLSNVTYGHNYSIGSDVGDYTVSITNIENSDYDITKVSGTLTVTARPIEIIWESSSAYTYTGNDQIGTVKCYYVDIDNNHVSLLENVELKNAGSYTLTAKTLTDNNYKLSDTAKTQYTLSIAKKDASVTIGSKSVEYGWNMIDYADITTVNGAINNENIGTATSNYEFGSPVNTYTVAFTANEVGVTNYNISVSNGSLNVTPRTINSGIVWSGDSGLIYNGLSQKNAVGATFTDIHGNTKSLSLSYAFNNGSTSKARKNALSDGSAFVNAGTYIVTISYDGNYTFTLETRKEIKIEPKTVTVTVTVPKSVTYGDSLSLTAENSQYDWVYSGDTDNIGSIQYTYGGASTYDSLASAGSAVGIVASGYSNSNYTFEYKYMYEGDLDVSDTIAITVAKRTAPVVWNLGTYIYNGNDQKSGTTATFTDIDGNDIPMTVVYPDSFKNAGSYELTATNTNANYSYTNTAITAVIGTKSLTVNLHNKETVYGENAPAFTFNATGIIAGDVIGTYSYTTDYTVGSGVKEDGYSIYMHFSSVNPNYTLSNLKNNGDITSTATLTVNPRPVTVKIDNKGITFGDSIPTYTAEVTKGSLYDKQTIANLGDFVCAYTTDKTNENSWAKKYTITFNKTNANYDVTVRTGTLTVSKLSTDVVWAGLKDSDNKNHVYNGSVQQVITANILGSVSLRISYQGNVQTNTVFQNADTYTLTASLDSTATDYNFYNTNYELSGIESMATIDPKPVTITVANANVTYGYPVSIGISVNDDMAKGVLNAKVDFEYTPYTNSVGTYSNIGAKYDSNSNYAVTVNKGSLTVTKQSVAVVWDLGSYTYNGSDQKSGTTATYTPYNKTAVSMTVNYPDSFKNAGTDYTLTATATDKENSNFTFTNSTATATIGRKLLTISVKKPDDIEFGDPIPTYDKTINGLVDGDTIGGELYCTYSVGSNKGTYDIDFVDYDNSNYDFAVNKSTLTVKAKSVSIVWESLGSYIYNGENRFDTVKAYYLDINGDKKSLLNTKDFTNAGTYEFTTIANTNANYVVSGETSKTLTIAPASITVVVTNQELTYGADKPDISTIDKVSGIIAVTYGELFSTDLLEIGTLDYDYAKGYNANASYYITYTLVSSNYTVSNASEVDGKQVVRGNVSVGRKKINTVDWSALENYTYNGQDQKDSVSATFTDIFGDTKTLSVSYLGQSESNIDINKFKDVDTYTLSVSYSDNYTFESSTQKTVEITQKTVNITINSLSLPYGDALSTIGGYSFVDYSSDICSGDTVGTLSLTSAHTSTSDVDSYLITASGLNNRNYEFVYNTAYVTVTKREVSIAVVGANAVYGTSLNDINKGTIDYGDVLEADKNKLNITANYSEVYQQGKNVGAYDLEVTCTEKDGKSNYDITILNTNPTEDKYKFCVTVATVDLNWSVATYTYCGSTISLNSVVSYSTYNGTEYVSVDAYQDSNKVDFLNAGNYTLKVTANGSDDGNYVFSESSKTYFKDVEIARKTLTIRVDKPADIEYGADKPSFTHSIDSINGLVTGESISSISIVSPYIKGSAERGKVADYEITIESIVIKNNGTDTTANYNIDTVGNTLTVVPKPVTIVWEHSGSYTYNGTNRNGTVNAYYTAINGDKVSLLITQDFINAGTYTFETKENTDANYAVSGDTSKTLTIAPAPIEVSFKDNLTVEYGNDFDFVTNAIIKLNGVAVGNGALYGDDTITSIGEFSGYTKGDSAGKHTIKYTLSITNYEIANSPVVAGNHTNVVTATLTVNADHNTVSIVWSGFADSYTYKGADYKTELTITAKYCDNSGAKLGDLVVTGPEGEIKNVGNYTFTASVSSTDENAKNYTFPSSMTYTLTVSPATISITIGTYSIEYGSVAPDYANITSLYSISDTTYDSINVIGSFTCDYNQGDGVKTGGYSIGFNKTSDNYTVSVTNGTLTVTPKALTITANSHAVSFGTTVTNGFTPNGLIELDKDSITISQYGCDYVAGDQTNGKVGNYDITINDSAVSIMRGETNVKGNYDITYVGGSITVSAYKVTSIDWTGITSYTYDGKDHNDAITASHKVYDGTPIYMTVTFSGKSTTFKYAGDYKVTAKAPDTVNYDFSGVSLTKDLTIDRRPITITVDNQSVIYGYAAPTFTATYNGLIDGDTIGNGFSCTYDIGDPVGNYDINLNNYNNNSNYTVTTYTVGKLIVKQRELTISVGNTTKTYGDSALTTEELKSLTSITGLYGSDNVGSTACDYKQGDSVKDGGYSIVFTFSDNANYTVKSNTSGTLTVNKKTVTVSVGNTTKAYGDPELTTEELKSITSIPGLYGSDSVGSTTCNYTKGNDVGKYRIVFTSNNNTNYKLVNSEGTEIETVSGTLTVNAKEVTLNWKTDYTYKGAVQTPTATFPNALYEEGSTTIPQLLTANISIGDSKVFKNAGSYSLTATSYDNYTFTNSTQEVVINKEQATITFTNAEVVMGNDFPTLNYSIEGLYNGDTTDNINLSITHSYDKRTTTAGTYSFTITADNYTFNACTYVVKADTTLELIWTNRPEVSTWVYNGTAHPSITAKYTYNGTKYDAVISITKGGESVSEIKDVGTYTVSASSKSEHKNIGFSNGYFTITITAKPVSIEIGSKDITFGDAFSLDSVTKTINGTVNSDSLSNVQLKLYNGGNAITYEQGTTGVGTYEISIASVTVNDKSGADVTANYTITTNRGTLTISTRTTSVDWDTTAFTYNGSEWTVTAKYTAYNGDKVEMDILSYLGTSTSNNGDTSFKKAGTYTVTAKAKTADELNNYTFTGANANKEVVNDSVIIAAASITIKIGSHTVTYGDSVPTYENIADIYSITSGTLYDSITAVGNFTCGYTATSNVNADGYNIDFEASNSNYSVTVVTGKLIVKPAERTLSWNGNSTYTYDGKTKTISASFTGINGQINIPSSNFDCKYSYNGIESVGNVSSIKNVGVYTITASYPNYTFTNDIETVTINPKEVVLSVSDVSVLYGDDYNEVNDKINSAFGISGLVSNSDIVPTYALYSGSDTFTYIKGTSHDTYTIKVTYTANANYKVVSTTGGNEITELTSNLIVNRKALTISATATTVKFGETPTLGYSQVGLIDIDSLVVSAYSVTDANNVPFEVGNAETGGIGAYTIGIDTVTIKRNGNSVIDNYVISYNTNTLTVNPAVRELTWSDYSDLMYNGDTQNVKATFTGLSDSEIIEANITYVKETESTAKARRNTVSSESTVDFKDAGNYTAIASYPNYVFYVGALTEETTATPSVSTSVNIAPAPITVTITVPQTVVYGSSTIVVANSYTAFGKDTLGTVQYTYGGSDTYIASTEVGKTVSIVASGLYNSNYTITYKYKYVGDTDDTATSESKSVEVTTRDITSITWECLFNADNNIKSFTYGKVEFSSIKAYYTTYDGTKIYFVVSAYQNDSMVEFKNAGEYTLRASINTGDTLASNYNFTASLSVANVVISPKTVSVEWSGLDKTFTYKGSEYTTITATVSTDETATLTISYLGTSESNRDNNEFLNAGKYTLTADWSSSASETVKNNYTLSNTTQEDITISAASITVTINDPSLCYGDSDLTDTDMCNKASHTPLFESGYTLLNIGTFSSTYTQGANASTSYTVSYSLTDTNYTLSTTVSATFTVSKRTITIRIADISVEYGSAVPDYSKSTSIISGTLYPTTSNIDDIGAFTCDYTNTTSVTTESLTIGFTPNSNYSVKIDRNTDNYRGTLTVTPKIVSVIWSGINDSYTYDGTDQHKNSDGSLSITAKYELINGSYSDLTVDYYFGSDKVKVTEFKNAGTYELVANFNGDVTNYSLDSDTTEKTIKQKALTITAENKEILFGAAKPTFTYINGELVSGDTIEKVTLSCGYETGNAVGNYDIVPSNATIKSGSTDVTDNYDISYKNGTLSVTNTALTITAKNESITFGDAKPTFDFTPSGLVNGDTATVEYNCSYVQGTTGIGTYEISIDSVTVNDKSGADVTSNYTINTNGGTLTVNAKPVEVEWTIGTYTYTGDVQSVTAKYTAYDGETEVTMEVTYKNGESVVDFKNAGDYTLTATHSDTNYIFYNKDAGSNTASRTVTNNATIKPKNVTITIDNATVTYGHNVTIGLSVKGVVLGDNLNESVDFDYKPYEKAVGEYLDIGAKYDNNPNYSVDVVKGSLTVEKQSVEVVWNLGSYTYNGSDQKSGTTATYTPYNQSTAKFLTVNYPSSFKNAGTNYELTASATAEEYQNYIFINESTKVNIAKAEATIVVDGANVTYGEAFTLDSVSSTISGLVNGDSLSNVQLKLYSGKNAITYVQGETGAGTYTIKAICGENDNPNYTVRVTNGALTVDKRKVTVTMPNYRISYGDDVPNINDATLSNVYGSDTVGTVTGSTTYSKGSPVGGDYIISGTFAISNSNYELDKVVNGKITVSKRSVKVIWTKNTSYTYNGSDQINSISAKYTAYDNTSVDMTVTASQNSIAVTFKNAGTYSLTASHSNTNYTFTNETCTVEIAKASWGTKTHDSITIGTYGPKLSDITLNGGFHWVNGNTVPAVGTNSYDAYYNTDSTNYENSYLTISVTVESKATATPANKVTITVEYNPETTVGSYLKEKSFVESYGKGYSWADSVNINEVLNAGTYEYKAIYNPAPANYFNAELTIFITVNKAEYTEVANVQLTGTYDPNKTLSMYTLPDNYWWKNDTLTPTYSKESTSTEVLTAGTHEFDVYYNEEDKINNYEYAQVKLTITITKKTVAVVWSGLDKTFAYTGNEQKEGITATYDGNAMDIEFVNNANVDNKIKFSFSNAGTYTLTAKIKSSDTISSNYIISNKTKEITISKAVISLHDKEFTYDYSDNGYTIVPQVDYNGTTYTLSDSGTSTVLDEMGLHTGDLVYSGTGVTGKKFTDGGTYTVTISISANEPNWTIDTNNNKMIVKINSVYVVISYKYTFTYKASILSSGNGTASDSDTFTSYYINIEDALKTSFNSNILNNSSFVNYLKNYIKENKTPSVNLVKRDIIEVTGVSNISLSTIIVAENTRLNNSATVNSGVTLLVPYDSSYKTSEKTQDYTTQETSNLSVYRKLTVSSLLTVKGTLNVSGLQYQTSVAYTGFTTGNYGLIEMTNNSFIDVESGGKLISFGFIKNRNINSDDVGSIRLSSGANAYEPLRIHDWTGGQIANAVKDVFFPFNQFYIGNIESQLDIYAGASLNAQIAIVVSKSAMEKTVEMFGTTGLFGITSGYVTKQVVSGKINITINKNSVIATNNITASLSAGLSSVDITTSGKEIPICGFYNIIVKGTANINSRFKLLPGSSLVIERDATCNINSGGALIGVINEDGSNYNYTQIYYNGKTVKYPLNTSAYASNSNVTICNNGTMNVHGVLAGKITATRNGSLLYVHADSTLNTTIIMQCEIETESSLIGTTTYKYTDKVEVTFNALTNGQQIVKDSSNTITYTACKPKGATEGYFVAEQSS